MNHYNLQPFGSDDWIHNEFLLKSISVNTYHCIGVSRWLNNLYFLKRGIKHLGILACAQLLFSLSFISIFHTPLYHTVFIMCQFNKEKMKNGFLFFLSIFSFYFGLHTALLFYTLFFLGYTLFFWVTRCFFVLHAVLLCFTIFSCFLGSYASYGHRTRVVVKAFCWFFRFCIVFGL
jgi:hypothetical protein